MGKKQILTLRINLKKQKKLFYKLTKNSKKRKQTMKRIENLETENYKLLKKIVKTFNKIQGNAMTKISRKK